MDANPKIKPEEIAILTAGEQIRRKVLGSGKTIDDFAREINFYPVSVKQYLRRLDGGSSSFKVKLTQYFQEGYDEIVKNPQAQLDEKCRRLSESIHLYTEEADAEVISELFAMVEQMGMTHQFPWMQRNLAMNRFYRNRCSEALALLRSAEADIQGGKDVMAKATFAADIALVYYYLGEYSEAYHWIIKAGEELANTTVANEKLHFLIAFRSGVIQVKMRLFDEAVVNLKEALGYAHEETFAGVGNLHLAEALYRQGEISAAKDAYRTALTALESDPLRQSYVYSSFAEMLLGEGDVQRARYFSEKAVTLCQKENYVCGLQHFETYAKIQIRLGDSKAVCQMLADVIERSSGEFIYRNQILDALKILLDCLDTVGVDLTVRLEDLLTTLIEEAGDEEPSYKMSLIAFKDEITVQKKSALSMPG